MKKGFTLVELLAVITLFALMALFVSTSVTKIIKNSRDKMYENQIISIEKSARIWAGEHLNILPNEDGCIYFNLGYLKETGLLDENIINSKNNEKINDDLIIKITCEKNDLDKLIYKYEVDTTEIDNCVLIKE